MLEKIKLKSRSPGITESRSFLVRYRRTYVLNNQTHKINLYFVTIAEKSHEKLPTNPNFL